MQVKRSMSSWRIALAVVAALVPTSAIVAVTLGAPQSIVTLEPPRLSVFREGSEGSRFANVARALATQAEEAVCGGDLNKAERLFRVAWQFDKTYDVAGHLGSIMLANGKPCEAAEHLETSLELIPPIESPEREARLRERLKEARARCGAPTVPQPAPAHPEEPPRAVTVPPVVAARRPERPPRSLCSTYFACGTNRDE